MTALFMSHYVYVVGALQVVGGIILLSGRYVPLGLTLLGPVIVNIVCFHVLMAPAGLPMALVVSLLALFPALALSGTFRGAREKRRSGTFPIAPSHNCDGQRAR